MMLTWLFNPISIFILIASSCAIWLPFSEANILHSVLGLPSECTHNNVIRSCTLSFSCWIQGGRHAEGCGENKWLFSCCISENEMEFSSAIGMKAPIKSNYFENELPTRFNMAKIKTQIMPTSNFKHNMLRRRMDDDGMNQFECGVPRTAQNTIQKRIIGGRVAGFAALPWQAHIRIAEYQCGGVLVSRHFVITAAHCIEQARMKDIIVYLGELDTQDSGKVHEPMPAEKHYVNRKIIHPNFKFRIAQPDRYDLALLQLAIPTFFTNHILPICLPTTNIDLTGRHGVIAGWGKTSSDLSSGHTGTGILQTASVPIISATECIKWHKKKNIFVELYEEMFCAGYSDGKQDACLGDSGGGLYLFENGKFTLVGITSAGFGCGVDHQPGIYHNVQMTTKWIQNVLNRYY
ncbi:serine proteinase stubble [Contarinia nasturtii]|uniref:serine proteinase stubble n=1 Tax=Contarinia nasturtii TaxID=265458 RepID=UPI0012D3BDB8|nr:serine proteinase stubble [Contarinia nasturtii]XP_031641019.1 serine proteinase stubble [Contarinia nasturtii]